MSHEEPRVWLVTGSSSGFGRRMVELALAKGDKVVATLRTPAALDDLRTTHAPSRLLILPLDVRDRARIADAFRQAKHAFGRVDVVFNNAGVAIGGEVEGTPEAAARRHFDVNFWGATGVSVEAVRFFREENPPAVGGRLLVNSSLMGLSSVPSGGFYSAAKFALEGVTQTLASELEPSWNIKITLIEPGVFRTNVYAEGKGERFPLHPAYSNPAGAPFQMRQAFAEIVKPIRGAVPSGDTSKAVEKIYELALLPQPPMRLVLGKDALAAVRGQLQMVAGDVDAYEAWSEDLMED